MAPAAGRTFHSAPRQFSNGQGATELVGWREHLRARGVSCEGRLFIACADQALDVRWLRFIGASLLWEALDDYCKHRREITRAVQLAIHQAPVEHVLWCHSVPEHRRNPHRQWQRIWRQLNLGKTVVVFCVQSHHRSVGSPIRLSSAIWGAL